MDVITIDNSDLLRNCPTSEVFPGLRVAVSSDAYDAETIGVTEKIIERYRDANPDAWQWDEDIGVYPVPDCLNQFSDMVTGLPYYHIEIATGRVIESSFHVCLDILRLRSFVVVCLSAQQNPVEKAKTIRRDVQDVERYLGAITRRMGGAVHETPTNRLPMTIRQSPWTYLVPKYDGVFAEVDALALTEEVKRAFEVDVELVIGVTGIDYLRQFKSKKKMKSLEDKKAKWESKRGPWAKSH